VVEITTAFVLDADPLERAWIASALQPMVDSLVVVEASPMLVDMLQQQARGCLIACAEPEDGFLLALVRELRRRACLLPVIVLGSNTAFRTAVEMARLDATEFLERPLMSLQLRAAVRKAGEIRA
jgi:DNA-binding NtrC family response regulator